MHFKNGLAKPRVQLVFQLDLISQSFQEPSPCSPGGLSPARCPGSPAACSPTPPPSLGLSRRPAFHSEPLPSALQSDLPKGKGSRRSLTQSGRQGPLLFPRGFHFKTLPSPPAGMEKVKIKIKDCRGTSSFKRCVPASGCTLHALQPQRRQLGFLKAVLLLNTPAP